MTNISSGQKHAAYDRQGKVIGFYDDALSPVPGTLPDGVAVIEITNDEWRNAIASRGWTVVNGKLVEPPPFVDTPITLAGGAFKTGCQIRSVSMPPLNYTYLCDGDSQSKVQGLALYIKVNGKLPAGKAEIGIADASGIVRTFTSTDEVLALGTALGDYVTLLEDVISGQSTKLPPQPWVIP
jgi:hypothetical protein